MAWCMLSVNGMTASGEARQSKDSCGALLRHLVQQGEGGLLELSRGLGLEEARLRPPRLVPAEGVLLLGRQVAGVVVGHANHQRRLERALGLDVEAGLAER